MPATEPWNCFDKPDYHDLLMFQTQLKIIYDYMIVAKNFELKNQIRKYWNVTEAHGVLNCDESWPEANLLFEMSSNRNYHFCLSNFTFREQSLLHKTGEAFLPSTSVSRIRSQYKNHDQDWKLSPALKWDNQYILFRITPRSIPLWICFLCIFSFVFREVTWVASWERDWALICLFLN